MPILHRVFHLMTLLLTAAPIAAAQEANTSRTAKACATAEHRQFDFWIGDWEVLTPEGNLAGHNLIEGILGGCAVSESWTGSRGGVGRSYNAYDRMHRKWHQTWVDNSGSVIQLDGEFAGGKMVLVGEGRDSTGGKVLNRITWQETAPGAVRQLWEQSADGGKTWTTSFDGRYKKRAA
jgi:hypothetical protein